MMRVIITVLLLAFPLSALADTADDLHIKAAFAFAHKKMWVAATQEATAGHSHILAKYFSWEYLRDPESDAGFDNITAFMEDSPDWPDQPTLLKHAEVALLAGNPSDEELTAWFRKHPPQTSLALRKAAKTPEALHALIREAWITDNYDKATESKLLAKYHSILRAEDHVRRIDRLLWEGRDDEAKRLLKYVPYGYQRLFQARLSLANDKQNAPVEVVNVPPSLSSDAGLLYERLRWRIRRGDKDGARELLLAAPMQLPYPEKWWPMRDRQIREALGEGEVKLALALLARHGQPEGSLAFKEVKWLEGWIALEYAGQPEKAYTIFSQLYKDIQTPGGKSRVAYWAGRAALAAGKTGSATGWFGDAGRYPTTFYGQIAIAEANSRPTLGIRSDAEPTREERERFRRRELVQLVYALGSAHQSDLAARFILYLVDDAESPGEAILATHLGRDINRIDFSVRSAKKALGSDIVSLSSGWPVIRFSHTQGIETPLLLALSRQESEFFADAVSSSGALGLMQLLPATAREIARKNDLAYSADRLFDPDYNMTVGSLYLEKMLERFSGSYVLSIASYNAGPGRIGQWIDLYGRPGSNVHAVLDWIERIPTTETRNYVQHVLENVQVYRFVLAGRSRSSLTIAEDLVR
jgi:soluble lytic murein transglycosylase